MTNLIGGLLSLGLFILNVVLVIGLMVALGRVALGHREGYRHVFGVLVAMVIVVLLASGDFPAIVHDIAQYGQSGSGRTLAPIPGTY